MHEEQTADESTERLDTHQQEGVARKNAKFFKENGILYRAYQDRRQRSFEQLVVPAKYSEDILRMAHNSWSEHLGIKKTKARLLQEFYWPGCFHDAEHFFKPYAMCASA